jgi:predicted amidohydrolase
VVVLPEMFASGFSMSETGAEIGKGPALQWMQVQANRLGALIVGSLKVKQQNSFYNRLYAVQPDGTYSSYDKRHLFRMGDEHKFYQSGDQRVIVSYKGWNIALFICYDLRFPVWSRNVSMAYDAAIYVANWPAPRANAWRTLLQARAIENLAYVVGVNRVGTDANALAYAGDSLLVDFKGDLVLDLKSKDQILTSELSLESLAEFRAKFPAHLDADSFSLSSL